MDQIFDGCVAAVQSRKIRRISLATVILTVVSVVLWIKRISPYLVERQEIRASLNNGLSADDNLFGSNIRPQFPDMVQIENLDPNLLPQGTASKHTDHRHQRRLIFIGDIHGCLHELRDLLRAVRYDGSRDHIIALGDMVNKGPDSLGVVDFLMQEQASCVRGNHEDRILLLASQLSSPLQTNFGRVDPGSVHQDAEPSRDRELARSLNQHQLKYLNACPVILRVGDIKALGSQIVAVHAGLVPGLPLQSQDPGSAMSMRIIDLKTHLPSKDHDRQGSVHWAKIWNKYQKLLPAQTTMFPSADAEEQRRKEMHTTVVYGHDSQRGLQIRQYAKGLDTGCWKGGQLSALVVADGGKQEVMQVKCKDHTSRSLDGAG